MFQYGERNLVKDVGELSLDELVKIAKVDFGLNINDIVIFQKFEESWGEWVDVTSEREFQNRDKIKVLVQTTNGSSSNDTGTVVYTNQYFMQPWLCY